MRSCLSAFVFLLIFITVSLSHCVTASAASLSVTMSVGLTYFQASGYTSPAALVYLKEGGSIVATTTAGSDGSFTLTQSAFDGTYTYTIYARDQNGQNTQSITTTVALTPGNTTTLSNLVLPPSYTHNGLDKVIGQDLIFSGMGVPNSLILLVVGGTTTYTTQIDQSGRYTSRLTTDNLSKGTHSLFLKNQLSSGLSSDATLNLTLTLHDRPQGSVLCLNCASPSPSAITRPTTQLPWWFRFFDLDGDGKLPHLDLSNIVSRWLREWLALLSKKSGTCDLNQDGVCNLVDLSILLYYIGR